MVEDQIADIAFVNPLSGSLLSILFCFQLSNEDIYLFVTICLPIALRRQCCIYQSNVVVFFCRLLYVCIYLSLFVQEILEISENYLQW